MELRPVLWIVATLLFTTTLAEGTWSKWSMWSDCSRSCGGGAKQQIRKCFGDEECPGNSIRYQLCNQQPCASGSQPYRDKQCADFNTVPYQEKIYKWTPYYSTVNPCSLLCSAERESFVANLARKVADGTPCNHTSPDICVGGRCLTPGCEGYLVPIDQKKECDECGDGGCEKEAKAEYEWKPSHYSRCSVTCGVGVQHSSSVCTEIRTGHIVYTSFCSHLGPPLSNKRKCENPDCLVTKWFMSDWGDCSVSCGGGTTVRYVYCTEARQDGYRQRVHDIYCPDPRPDGEKECNINNCPIWYAGEWSPCTATCGDGIQYREVICKYATDITCDRAKKPDIARKCSAQLPCFGRNVVHESKKNGKKFRLHGHSTIPRFESSHWSPCSAACGFGERSRIVECHVFLKYLNRVETLPDAECKGIRPRDSEECFDKFCQENSENDYKEEPQKSQADSEYNWRYSGFTPCSKTCLRGRQDSLSECIRKSDNGVVNPRYCMVVPGLPAISRVCNDVPCPPRWKIREFSECTERCGGGTKSRQVDCVLDEGKGEKVIKDAQCSGDVPDREVTCNTQLCPPEWHATAWTKCSVTCGRGFQTRTVFCKRVIPGRDFKTITDEECPEQKPMGIKDCGAICEHMPPEIRTQKQTYIQFKPTLRVVVRVGSTAIILAKTTLVVRCSVKYFNRNLIYWMRDNLLIPLFGRVKVLKSGALRIRKSRNPQDVGNYTCYAGSASASVEVMFHTLEEAKEKARIREKYLTPSLSKLSENYAVSKVNKYTGNNVALSQDQPATLVKDASYSRKGPNLVIVIGNWSSCSRTCGGIGFQTRLLTCEEITLEATRIRAMHICKKNGHEIPEKKQICKGSGPCPKWIVGRWSQCEQSPCVRLGYATQHRLAYCRHLSGTILGDSSCRQKSRPITKRDCTNFKCVAAWKTSEWSQCLPLCAEEGNKSRMLFCNWQQTNKPAGSLCRGKPRPQTKRKCRPETCDITTKCHDDSANCGLIFGLQMCKYGTFSSQCCQSCRSYR